MHEWKWRNECECQRLWGNGWDLQTQTKNRTMLQLLCTNGMILSMFMTSIWNVICYQTTVRFWIVINTQLLEFVCGCNAIKQRNKKRNIHGFPRGLERLKHYASFLCILIGCVTTAAVTYVQNTCRVFLGPIVRGELLLGLTQPVPGTSTLIRVRSSPGMTAHTWLIMMGMTKQPV